MSDDIAALSKFRPVSLDDFGRYARNMAWFCGLSLQESHELLARIYGYSGLLELQVVLAREGKPGPFEDDAHMTPRAAARRNDRAEEVIREFVKERSGRLPLWLDCRLCQLNALRFFGTPGQHRRAAARVRPLLGEERGRHASPAWPNLALELRNEALLEDPGWMKPEALGAFALAQESKGCLPLHPDDMRKSIAAHRDATLVLLTASRELEPHADLGILLDDWEYEVRGFALYRETDFGELRNEALVVSDKAFKEFLRKYELPRVWNTFEAERAVFEAYLRNPTSELLSRSRVLQLILDPERLAEQARWQWVVNLALAYNRYGPRKTWLTTGFTIPEGSKLRELGDELVFEMVLQEDPVSLEHSDRSTMSYWQYSAVGTVMNRRTSERRPISVMRGFFVQPFGPEKLGNTDFRFMMNLEKEHLAAAGELVLEEYLPFKEIHDIGQWNGDTGCHTFATADLEVSLTFESADVEADMLQCFRQCIDDYPATIQGQGWDCFAFEDFDVETEEGEMALTELSNYPGEGCGILGEVELVFLKGKRRHANPRYFADLCARVPLHLLTLE